MASAQAAPAANILIHLFCFIFALSLVGRNALRRAEIRLLPGGIYSTVSSIRAGRIERLHSRLTNAGSSRISRFFAERVREAELHLRHMARGGAALWICGMGRARPRA